ncbi:hypothetical protein U0070_006092 [Myodes glareolus]|uniref:Uncharacterized protein n=1 Tax=Myodes glareolus TaxID=447135 RepID=A0AAW0IAS8_MYOGA
MQTIVLAEKVEHLAFWLCSIGNEIFVQQLQYVIADVLQLSLYLLAVLLAHLLLLLIPLCFLFDAGDETPGRTTGTYHILGAKALPGSSEGGDYVFPRPTPQAVVAAAAVAVTVAAVVAAAATRLRNRRRRWRQLPTLQFILHIEYLMSQGRTAKWQKQEICKGGTQAMEAVRCKGIKQEQKAVVDLLEYSNGNGKELMGGSEWEGSHEESDRLQVPGTLEESLLNLGVVDMSVVRPRALHMETVPARCNAFCSTYSANQRANTFCLGAPRLSHEDQLCCSVREATVERCRVWKSGGKENEIFHKFPGDNCCKHTYVDSLRFRQVNTEERGMCRDVERQQISDIVKDRESDVSNYGDNELRVANGNCDQFNTSGLFKDYNNPKYWANVGYKYFIKSIEAMSCCDLTLGLLDEIDEKVNYGSVS